MTLRNYQTKMVRDVSAAYMAGAKGVMLRCPTGGGKTRTATNIVQRYTETGRQVLWLVDQEELLDQAAMTFAQHGIEHVLVCSADTERAVKANQFRALGKSLVRPGARAVVASVQTLVRRLDGRLPWLDPAQIIADEADLSLAATWRKVIGHWDDARLLGLTATPIRMDRQSFAREDGGLYDSIVVGPTEAWLIENGFLAAYDAYAPDVHLQEGVADLTKMRGDDYDPQELEKELDAPKVYGDVVEHYRNYSHGKPAIAFCPTVASAEKFAAAFRAAGYRAQALDGMTDSGVRRRAVEDLGNGGMDVLTGVGLLVKGVDIPYATTAIWLRRTKSLRIFLQGTGRVLRPHSDKSKALILDCVGVIKEHGLPHEEREWSLKPPAKKAKRADNDNEPDVLAKVCPKCRGYHKPGERHNDEGREVCPLCGHEYPARAERKELAQVDAGLRLVTAEDEERMRRMRRAAQGQAKTVADLVAQGISRGRAVKIVEAREQKTQLVGNVLDALEAARKRSGQPTWQEFGVSQAQVLRMKPKELRELLSRAAPPLEVRAA